MRYVRYWRDGAARWGILEGEELAELEGSPCDGAPRCGRRIELAAVVLLAPATPSKIIGIGRNYPAHAAEHQAAVPEEPLLFLKPPTTIIGPGAAIELTPLSQQVEHEAELAVVIGRRGRHIDQARALEHVLGYTAANDVTARDLQRRDAQWTRGKGFDTFCPLGPWIETDLDLTHAQISCSVNGQLRQLGSPREMVFGVSALLAYISQVMTLAPGDVILTGTPSGVGPLHAGDEVVVTIEGLGELRNPVRG